MKKLIFRNLKREKEVKTGLLLRFHDFLFWGVDGELQTLPCPAHGRKETLMIPAGLSEQ